MEEERQSVVLKLHQADDYVTDKLQNSTAPHTTHHTPHTTQYGYGYINVCS